MQVKPMLSIFLLKSLYRPSVRPSDYQSVRPSVCTSILLSVRPSVRPSVSYFSAAIPPRELKF
jgi:hypothetical protein